jgi:hypothetical protein
LSYTCNCHDGYEKAVGNQGGETCVEIDECTTLGGIDSCSNGKCVDEILGYKCECDPGYQVDTNEDGLEECSPVICGFPPVVDHATNPRSNEKLGFPEFTEYTCAVGHTLDGTAEGEVNFEISCEADAAFTGVKECKAIDCGKMPTVENAEASHEGLFYPEKATYTCAEGHQSQVNGALTGKTEWEVTCADDGTLSGMVEEGCHRVSCGRPDVKQFAAFNAKELVYEDTVKYTCNNGYTTTGLHDGATSFTMVCGADQLMFEEEEPKSEGGTVCSPVTCGIPPQVDHAEMPLLEFFYMQQFQVFCDKGFTQNGEPDGEETFIVKCNDKGNFEGIDTCKPVTCGKPKGTDTSTSEDGEKFFKEIGKWHCKEGYSVDGKKKGGKSFEKMCTANGAFGDSAPNDCVDIDFCLGGPCGFNGVCTDSGPGVTSPGYECTCNEGFELGTRENGGPTCKADDCAGNPCGQGGACTDLSKTGGAPGQYTCECEDGYQLEQPEPGMYTCKRRSCGIVPDVHHLAEVDGVYVHTQDDEPMIDEFTSRFILKSFLWLSSPAQLATPAMAVWDPRASLSRSSACIQASSLVLSIQQPSASLFVATT